MIDRNHNAWRGRLREPCSGLEDYEQSLLSRSPATLDRWEREVVARAVEEVCRYEGWTLHASHVRSNHVHAVVSADVSPEKVMAKLKAYSSRLLNRHAGKKLKRWTRHGSTVWLWAPGDVDEAVEYVIRRQGRPMVAYENLRRWQEYLRRTRTEPRS